MLTQQILNESTANAQIQELLEMIDAWRRRYHSKSEFINEQRSIEDVYNEWKDGLPIGDSD